MAPCLASALLAVGLLLAGPGLAVTFMVNTTTDAPDATPGDGICAAIGGACTLRAAIEEANTSPATDTVQLPEGTFSPAPMSDPQLSVTEDLDIVGAGMEASVIRTFSIVDSSNVEFNGFRDFSLVESVNPSAGIFVRKKAEFRRVRVAHSAGNGVRCSCCDSDCGFDQVIVEGNGRSGILSSGAARFRDSIARDNVEYGVLAADDELVIADSLIQRNGSGVFYFDEFGAVIRSVIEDNVGVGVDTDIDEFSGALYLIDSIVRRNGGGGVRASGGLVLRSTIVDNHSDACGGGLLTTQALSIVASTISGNSAPEGGGVCLRYSDFLGGHNFPLLVLGSTITDNEATRGGGISIDSTIPFDCVLSIEFQESIVAGNAAATSPDCFAPAVQPSPTPGVFTRTAFSEGHNLIGDGSGCDFVPGPADQIGTAEDPIDPRLAPLGDNGGPTPTHALWADSPARDVIPEAMCDASTLQTFGLNRLQLFPPVALDLPLTHDTDQRGVLRPQGLACDIGAFERESDLAVEIDIQARGPENRVNPRSRGVVSVALLGRADFDVTQVNVGTLAFGPDGASPVDPPGGRLADINRDGFDDLVSYYRVRDTGIGSGDTQACVSGETLRARSFKGCDYIHNPPRS